MVFTCDNCPEAASVHCFVHKQSLCANCDGMLHSGSKALQKHERVALTAHRDATQCDICQEGPAVMFCSEDRALICRQCDLMIHTANEFTKTHHRYILSGFVAGLRALPDVRPGDGAGAPAASAGATGRLPRVTTSSSTGELLNMPGLPSGAMFMGGDSSLGSSRGGSAGAGPSSGAGAGAGGSSGGSGGATADRLGSVTLAADLLGMPELPGNYSAKDVDAAWGDAGLGDVDDWSHFLEVPDLGFLDAAPDDDGPDGLFSGGFPTTPAACPATPGANPGDPVVSVHNPGLLASGVPPAAEAPPLQQPPQEAPARKPSGPLVTTSGALPAVPAPAPKSAPVTTGVTDGLRGRTAPEVPSLPKRSRVG